MFVRSLALGAFVLLSLVSTASADRWGGYYIGLNAGGGRSDTDTGRVITGTGYFADTSITAIQNASAMTLDEQTFEGGAQIGINWPLGESIFMLGFEMDAEGFGNDTSGSATVAYPCCVGTNFTTTNSIEQTWLATGRLRIGLMMDFALLYATGGYAGGDMKFTQTFSDTFSPIALQTIENSEFRSGYSVGGGIELMIESGASIKVEYLYLDLGEITATGPIAVGTRLSGGHADVTDQILRVGINFQMD